MICASSAVVTPSQLTSPLGYGGNPGRRGSPTAARSTACASAAGLYPSTPAPPRNTTGGSEYENIRGPWVGATSVRVRSLSASANTATFGNPSPNGTHDTPPLVERKTPRSVPT